MTYSIIIIGAGLYGLYSALYCARNAGKQHNNKILVLEYEDMPFMRASYINQARVHMGYHYPRSISTALKSAHYFNRFNIDYGFCIHSEFDQVYATSSSFSWSNAEQFRKFCMSAGIPCEDMPVSKYFKDQMCDGAFLTKEYTYDAQILREYFIKELSKFSSVEIKYNSRIETIRQNPADFEIKLKSGEKYQSDFVLNATYASVNQILDKLGYEKFNIKYELCEIILCTVNEKLKGTGITVMDGPFFSIMPFGKTGMHSLTSVTFTPHLTGYENLPSFKCQSGNESFCSQNQLGNCNDCPEKPKSAWSYMSNLARKYLKDEYGFEYHSSLFSIKPILLASEIDDSRPTLIKQFSSNPTFISVLSGKINTVYDLDEVIIR